MVKHIVTFKLKGSPSERLELAQRFRDALVELPSKIDVLKSIEVGLNQNPAETYDVVLTAVVSTLDEVGIYAKHPAHVAAAGIIGGHVEVRACVDYEY